MTLTAVTSGDAAKASDENQIRAKVNGSPGRAIFTANGLFTVPAGVHQFKVTLCGGGGRGGSGSLSFGGGYSGPGGKGGSAPMVSRIISGQAIGASFSVTIGAGSTTTAQGGTTSFGALLSSTGGYAGSSTSAVNGNNGVANFGGGTGLYHLNAAIAQIYATSGRMYGYGEGGDGQDFETGSPTTPGANGICIVEW